MLASVLFSWLMRAMPTTMAGLLAFWGDTLEDIVVERFGRLFIHLCIMRCIWSEMNAQNFEGYDLSCVEIDASLFEILIGWLLDAASPLISRIS